MAVFVLVPGGNSGAWYLQELTAILRAAGHTAYPCTLTGLGERSHLLSRSIDLTTHIMDVANVLIYEDLHDVILMGHSYAGMVITGVAERVAERIAHLVYLDALVPRDGEAGLDVFALPARASMEQAIRTLGDGWLMPVRAGSGSGDARRCPQPAQTGTQRLSISNPVAAALPHTYVWCTADKQPGSFLAGALGTSVARARAAGWRYREIDATHSVIRTHPHEVARLLLELARTL
jgi:pimeloyl-ACP methyl ester carboxylesterase